MFQMTLQGDNGMETPDQGTVKFCGTANYLTSCYIKISQLPNSPEPFTVLCMPYTSILHRYLLVVGNHHYPDPYCRGVLSI